MRSNGWDTWKIGDIGRIVTGKTPSTLNQNNFGDKYPFITPRDMLGQKRIHQTERYLSEEGKNTVKNCLLPAKSVCVSCIGSDMGKVVMTTTDSVTNQQLNSVICKASFDPDFVYYALVHISDELRNVGHSSTAVPILNKTDFSNFEITAPDIVAQRRIADILSALDEKIELNRQTNATLEAIAQSIFKEWFVDFNFPGTTGEMVDVEGELPFARTGMIPRRWRVGKLGEICEFAYGKGLKSENRAEGEYPVVGSNGIVGTHNEYLVEGPGIVIGRKGTIGEVAWIHKNFFPIDTTFYIKDLLGVGGLYFHYFLLKEQDFKKIASDSAVPGLNRNQAYDNLIVIPTPDVIKRFNEITFAIFENIINDEQQSSTLATIRDTLLPKLMNGEIEV